MGISEFTATINLKVDYYKWSHYEFALKIFTFFHRTDAKDCITSSYVLFL
jgi:hypothetical protein